MAKEMWFLRPLTEWPGFPTLWHSVMQCAAAVSLPGTWFLQECLFWENIIYFANIHDFLKTIRRIPMGFDGFSLKTHAKAYVSLSAPNPRPPTKWWMALCRRRGGQDAPKLSFRASWGPGLGHESQGAPPWGPMGPAWGPMATYTTRCPGFGPDEAR